MKKLFNLFLILMCLICFTNYSFASKDVEEKFDKIIEKSPLNETATISVSIKKVQKGNIIYEKNSKKLLHPASTLKLLTIMPTMNALGEKYLFKTQIYYDAEKNIYIKLGADPYLTSADLKSMLYKLKEQGLFPINNIYIDSTAIDGVEWGIGWMWDDDTNRLIPKYSIYNLDQNLLKIQILPTNDKEPAKIISSNSATTTIMNYVKTSLDKTDVGTARFNWVSPSILYIQGTVSQPVMMEVPVSNPQAYFLTELKKHLKNMGISYSKIQYAPLPEGKMMLTEKVSGVERALIDILQNSKNFVSETSFKLAAKEYTKSQGSTISGVNMFNDYYKNIILGKTDRAYIVDASGVSRNNLITADFMTDALNYIIPKNNFQLVKSYLATPGVGTLKNRLLDYKDNVWAKTGTLSGVSGIAGYIKSKNNNEYVFTILIQNFTGNSNDAKALEDELIKELCEM